MAKKPEAQEPEAVAADAAPAPAPDVLNLSVLKRILEDTRKLGPRRMERHTLHLSSELVGALASQNPAMREPGAKLCGYTFELDGNLEGLAYRLVKEEKPAQ